MNIDATAQKIQYPKTQKVDQVDKYFDNPVEDPYRWLESSDSVAVMDWIKRQNKVTFGYLEQIPYRDDIQKRLEKLVDYKRVSGPFKEGQYYYYTKNSGLQNQSVVYRKKSLDSSEEEIFLDPNSFSKDGTASLAGMSFSKDGSLCAYSVSEGGSDWRKIYLMDAETKKLLEDKILDAKFTGIAWQGKEGFYYSTYDKADDAKKLTAKTQYHKLYYHKLGTPQSHDQLVFGGEAQPRRYVSGYTTEDGRYLVIRAANTTSTNELYIRDLEAEYAELIPLVENFDSRTSVIASDGDRIILQTNWEAPNGRIVETNIKNPVQSTWKDMIPESKNVLNASTAGGKIFARYLEDAKSKIVQYDMKGKQERVVELPGIGTVSGFGGHDDDTEIYYSFTSFTYPSSIFKYDIASGKSELYAKPDIDFDPEAYITKQVFYESKDGTKIPMFITHKKGLPLNGNNPTYLYAYGGFNVSLTPRFSATRILWLENGGVYAQPNLRGGGEYGEEWHKAGTKMQKQNVFDDFIAAAEYLIEQKYTSSNFLAIAGGSNGGLLVGATMTQRPDLAKVAFPAVGVMDMLRYHKFTSGAGWAYDYGTADDSPEMFEYLKGYSPLHNLEPGTSYPATMVTTADHDDRVVPGHSFKFAARLQECHTGDNPVLIRIEQKAGHGAGKPISKVIQEWADRFSFAYFNMGFTPFQ